MAPEKPSAVRVPLVGVLDMANAPEAWKLLHDAVMSVPRGGVIVIDLDEVALLAAAGLTVLLAAHRLAHARRVELHLDCGQPHLLRLFALCDLTAVLPLQREASTVD